MCVSFKLIYVVYKLGFFKLMPIERKQPSPKIKNILYFYKPGKHTVARSPQESDRSNLLKDAEPMGYSDPHNPDPFQEDGFGDNFGSGRRVHSPAGGYQTRSVRPTSLRTNVTPSTGRQARNPPRGIFDDI